MELSVKTQIKFILCICMLSKPCGDSTGPRGLVVQEPRLRCPPSRVRGPATADLTWFPFGRQNSPVPVGRGGIVGLRSGYLDYQKKKKKPCGDSITEEDHFLIIKFHCDDGNEFFSNNFLTHDLKNHGIQQLVSCPRTSNKIFALRKNIDM